MKNPFSNETVKSAAIVIGSAVAFIAISKGIGALRKKFGDSPKVKAIFGAAENACRPSSHAESARNLYRGADLEEPTCGDVCCKECAD